tara:strand:- start:471 stop:848 length:378 start_codon:yes stop_codon:yes gene_type:complete
MKGYSPKLPLLLDAAGGYTQTKTVKQVISQNLKMLVLTSPGERIMDPLFGVGMYNYLFEFNNEAVRMEIMQRITEQVKKYLPFVQISEINFTDSEGLETDRNALGVVIKYVIPSLSERDVLRIQA